MRIKPRPRLRFCFGECELPTSGWRRFAKARAKSSVVMVSAPRPAGATRRVNPFHSACARFLCVRRTIPFSMSRCWRRMLAPTHIAVLDAEKVALYRWQGGKWQQEQSLGNRPCAAVAAGFARQADPCERSPAGCLSSRSDLPQCCGITVDAELPRDRRSLASCVRPTGGSNGGSFSVFPSAGSGNGASTVIPRWARSCPDPQLLHRRATPGVGSSRRFRSFIRRHLLPPR